MTGRSHRVCVFVLCLAVLAVYACEVLPDSATTDCDSELRCSADSRCTAAGDACIPVSDTCGDGQIQANEECDDGNRRDSDGCVECKLARCGDGVIQVLVERCDGEPDPMTGEPCRSDCQGYVSCGNGTVDMGELCDDGNQIDEDSCPSSCVPAFCGDGFVWDGVEKCDGQPDSDENPCRSDCRGHQKCGNGLLDPGELCDDGNANNSDACPDNPADAGEKTTCVPAFCDDGFVWKDVEECDPSDNAQCRSDCRGQKKCGNGLLDPGELCDDGIDPETNEPSNQDACPNNPDKAEDNQATCVPAFCGDGFVWQDVEQCDDNNHDNNDDCPNGPGGTCRNAYCGDGFKGPGEECDLNHPCNGGDTCGLPGRPNQCSCF